MPCGHINSQTGVYKAAPFRLLKGSKRESEAVLGFLDKRPLVQGVLVLQVPLVYLNSG